MRIRNNRQPTDGISILCARIFLVAATATPTASWKSEARNPKQTQNPNTKGSKQTPESIASARSPQRGLGHLDFGF
jgi:hypothetical protein